MADQVGVKWVVSGGSFVERLVCHSRLPLNAGLDSARPAVHVWELGSGGLREHGIIDAGPDAYPPEAWKRHGLAPSVAWHPHEPSLVVSGAAGLQSWTLGGLFVTAEVPPNAAYRDVAFSPDGRTLWASPSSSLDEDEAWQRSDALDLVTGALRVGPRWDTGVVEHPGGNLVVTLSSDQGATDVLFARPDDAVPASMRILRHAIILDADGYTAPVVSDDGRYLAVRGNAYVQSLDVFEFPTMRKVLHTTFGQPHPGYPYPPDWLEEQARWSRHNVAFAPGSGVILVGTPQGNIVQIDLDSGRASEHHVTLEPISALAVMSTDQLVVADRSGQLAIMDAPADAGRNVGSAGAAVARARVEEFVAAATELPTDADLDASLVRHDGQRTWNSDDLETVTTAEDADPTWLRLQSAINTHRQEHGEHQPIVTPDDTAH
ncbi:hypothetical protein ACIA5A_21020 [Micromonospora sp. NPDC051300]|uniref:hypothetical protein n=1 Tax=Micromonospora sp. NPDC051300 TaxID=3364286 RepID=UPI0037981C9E